MGLLANYYMPKERFIHPATKPHPMKQDEICVGSQKWCVRIWSHPPSLGTSWVSELETPLPELDAEPKPWSGSQKRGYTPFTKCPATDLTNGALVPAGQLEAMGS